MSLKWQILILTQPSREKYLKRLRECLDPQVSPYPDVEINIRMFDRQLSLGENRRRQMCEATADYINFVDDDDLVAPDYIATIYPLLGEVDYIGFQLQLYNGGPEQNLKQKPTYHSLTHRVWWDDDKGYYRDISHLNPIKRELAIQAVMEGGGGEDARWADAMRTLGIVKTERYIDRVMYHYYWRAEKND